MSLAENVAALRRLAAILAADIAGYSRIMGVDEEGTLARLKAHRRELIDPKGPLINNRIGVGVGCRSGIPRLSWSS